MFVKLYGLLWNYTVIGYGSRHGSLTVQFLCIFIVVTMSNDLLKINKHAGLLNSVGSGAALSIVIHRSGG